MQCQLACEPQITVINLPGQTKRHGPLQLPLGLSVSDWNLDNTQCLTLLFFSPQNRLRRLFTCHLSLKHLYIFPKGLCVYHSLKKVEPLAPCPPYSRPKHRLIAQGEAYLSMYIILHTYDDIW